MLARKQNTHFISVCFVTWSRFAKSDKKSIANSPYYFWNSIIAKPIPSSSAGGIPLRRVQGTVGSLIQYSDERPEREQLCI